MELVDRTADRMDPQPGQATVPLLSRRQRHLIEELRDTLIDRIEGLDGSTACTTDPEYRRQTVLMLRTLTMLSMLGGPASDCRLVEDAAAILGIADTTH